MPTAPQAHLIPSNAGMRLIAQTSLFNKGDFERLRTFITESYADIALEAISVKARLAELKAMYRMAGKMRIDRVVAVDKHTALVILETERAVFIWCKWLSPMTTRIKSCCVASIKALKRHPKTYRLTTHNQHYLEQMYSTVI
ncbi:MAG: hypothetical protein R3E39_25085 [Anaerolineae bacterium]